jgi:hypothetical protein
MDGVTSSECYQRMDDLRGEIQKFCDSIGGKIDELKDEVHCRELQAAHEKGEAAVEVVKEKVERTRQEWLLDHWRDVAIIVILVFTGSGRVIDTLPTILKLLGRG